jgi:hypothetical protein
MTSFLLRLARSRWVWLVGVMALVLIGASLFVVSNTQAAPEQPIAFNHESMVQKGVPCLFCHTGATKSPVAGIPSVAKCIGCHTTNEKNNPDLKKLTGYWERQAPIPWVRVNQLPRFVYFSHQAHVVNGGLNCERCHGDVGRMTVVRPAVNFTMGFCLTCHQQQANAKQLIDCVTCHK